MSCSRLESWNNFKGLETGMWTYDRGLQQTHDVKLLGKHGDHLTGHHTVMNRVADMLEPLNTPFIIYNWHSCFGILRKP